MKRFEKYISIEGGYFDCQLTSSKLLLWDMEGSVSFFDWKDIQRLKNQYPEIVPSNNFRGITRKQFDVPGKSLPSDTSIMNGKLYTASEYGLFTGASRHQQLWDARIFRLHKNVSSPIMALAGGEDGLFELNVSQKQSKGLQLAERSIKDIYRVSDTPAHYTSYIGFNLSASSHDSDILALFNQGKNIREYIREVTTTELNSPFVPEDFIVDNGVAYLQESDNLKFIQLRKGPIEGALIQTDAGTDMFGEIMEVTTSDLHTNFEFDKGLVILDNKDELLRINEPVTRWRSFVTKDKSVEWLIALLDNRIDIYKRPLEVTQPDITPEEERQEAARISSKEIITRIVGSGRVFKDGVQASNILNAIVKSFRGGVNIDFLDLDNWDCIESVFFDKDTNLMYLIRNTPHNYENEEIAANHRMVWGGDATALVIRFSELRIIEHRGYPFVSIKGAAVFPSVVKNNVQRMVGNIIEQEDSIYGSNFIVNRNDKIWYVRCMNGNLLTAVLMGKDIDWRDVDSSRLLLLENLGVIKKSVWESSIFMSRSSAKIFFKKNKAILDRIDRSLYSSFKELLKIDLAVRDVIYVEDFHERYSKDDFATMDVIEEYRHEDIYAVRELRSVFDFCSRSDNFNQYRNLHNAMFNLFMHYIRLIELDIVNHKDS